MIYSYKIPPKKPSVNEVQRPFSPPDAAEVIFTSALHRDQAYVNRQQRDVI